MSLNEEISGSAEGSFATDVSWPVQATAYNIISKIGKGAFATVYRATVQTESSSQSKYCAIKVIDLENMNTNFVDIRSEVQTMRLCNHPNIVVYHTSFLHHTNLWLVMQLMGKGSSSHCLTSARVIYNPLNSGNDVRWDIESHITFILHETILGLKYIHDNGQIHRDIKAGNILLDSNGNVRIADFGVSGWLIQGGAHRENTRTFIGTPCWMSPEVIEQIRGYDYKADLWSLGITALELAYGYAPYAKYPPMKVLVKTIQEDPPGFETYENEGFGDDDEWLNPKIEDWSQSFRDMVSWCLQKDPKKRPSCQELLSHAHFKPLNDKTVCLQYKERLVKEVLDKIPNVGAEDGDVTSNTTNDLDKSDIPVTIVTETDNNDDTRRAGTAWVFPEVFSEKRPSGTTWIFSDGSNVCVSAAEALGEKDDKEDPNAKSDFFDQFEKETQGEHFKHPSRQNSTSASEPVTEKSKDYPDTNEEDDLNAFMDQFEKETGGEDFRKNKL